MMAEGASSSLGNAQPVVSVGDAEVDRDIDNGDGVNGPRGTRL